MDWYADNRIDLRAGVRVVRIDRYARLVQADDGTVTHYDNLILATGSRSFFPPMAGLWADNKTLTDGVFGFRSLDDCMGMITQSEHRTKAVVIGGGLLGLEAARGLQNRGLHVEVVHAGHALMNAQLDDMAGAILRRSVEALGILVHTSKRTTEVRTDENGRLAGIVFSDGSSIDCDMLVIAAGIRPNVGLAQRSGLTVERAIVVDDHMRSIDDDHIYVVGECAQHRGQVYGLVAPLWEQAGRARRPSDRRRQDRRLPRVTHRDQTQGRWSRRRRNGIEGARASGRRVRAVLRTPPRRVQDHRHPGRKTGRRHAAR